MKMITRGKKYLEGCSSIKLAEYIEFLKLFKIALFNNRSRDIKVNRQDPKESNKDSIFLVRVDVSISNEGNL